MYADPGHVNGGYVVTMRFTVEPLPSHPSLEHQQKLAKRLLRAIWAGDAESIARVQALLPDKTAPESMQLHDAQLVVARGYGFDSWAAMKRKIESLTKTPAERFDIAIREGDAATARELLSTHAALRVAINEPRFDYNSPALHQAKKNLPLVDVLLEFGADINARSEFWAGSFGILEHDLTLAQARPLMEHGATLTAWAAAGLGLPQELKAIIAATPEVVRQRGGDGKTVLHCAATREIAEMLVNAGAELDAVDTDHNSTPLQYLIGDEEIARLLIDRGARADVFAIVATLLELDPNPPLALKNEFGAIPLRTCIYGSMNGWKTGFPQDHARTVRLLLEAGSPLDPAMLPTGNDELDSVMRDWRKQTGGTHVG